MNDYLQNRNKKFYRGSTTIVHPLYEIELGQAINSVTSFIDRSILARARLLREKALNTITLENCWNNTNFSFSEAQQCHELTFENDSVLGNIHSFKQEMQVSLLADYENKINPQNVNIYKKNTNVGLGEPTQILSEKNLEVEHRKFLVNLHLFHRFYYYYFAKYLFIDSLKYNI